MHRVLLIEQDADLGELYALALEKLGLIVHIATTGTQGLDHFKNTSKFPSLVVVDNNLPDMRGVDFIRQLPRMNGLKIILITDHVPDESSEEASLVDGFLIPNNGHQQIDRLIKNLLPTE